jgi:hypothetical protein
VFYDRETAQSATGADPESMISWVRAEQLAICEICWPPNLALKSTATARLSFY